METNKMSSTIKPKGTYRTSDLYLAAYFKVAGVPFTGITREENRAFFMFDAADGLDDLKLQFFNNISKVAARPYAEEIKAFKALVHSG